VCVFGGKYALCRFRGMARIARHIFTYLCIYILCVCMVGNIHIAASVGWLEFLDVFFWASVNVYIHIHIYTYCVFGGKC